jgi:DNA-binding MarR family transcriptional regulator
MSNTLCKIRDIQKAIEDYSKTFEAAHGLSLKEGMLLCCIAESERTASELACENDLSASNCSKVLASAEKKGLIQRQFGISDKRNVVFSLTIEGKISLNDIKSIFIEIPTALKNSL